jgi:hypothetical protein
MRFGLSKWRPKHLLAAWSTYWVALLLWGLGSALPAIWRMTRPEAKGSGSMHFGNGGFHLKIEGAGTAWDGSVSWRAVILLVAIPPLILWGFWLRSQRRAGDIVLGSAGELVHGEGRSAAIQPRPLEEKR